MKESNGIRLPRRQLLQMAGAAAAAGGLMVSRIGAADAAQVAQPSVTHIGRIVELDAFAGIVVEGQNVLAYVCDGRDTGVGNFAECFSGPIADGRANLSSENGAGLSLVFAAERATGRFIWTDGKEFPFTTVVARGVAGLYRVERVVGDQLIVGGWVVTEESEMRGKTLAKAKAL